MPDIEDSPSRSVLYPMDLSLINEWLLGSNMHRTSSSSSTGTPGDEVKPEVKITSEKKPLNKYVYLLISGNSFMFQPELVQKGVGGGRLAARALHLDVKQYLRDRRVPCAWAVQVNIDIYFDAERMVDEYGWRFYDFCCGFNAYREKQVAYQCLAGGEAVQFVDNILYALNDVGCQHIMFADVTLDVFRPLIDALVPNHPRGQSLIHKVDSFFKASVFRKGQDFQLSRKTPNHLRSPVDYRPPWYEQQASKSPDWRRPDETVTGPTSSPEAVSSADIDVWAGPFTDGNIARNKDGRRIDPPIAFTQRVRDGLARRKPRMCNVHHLRGPCPYGLSCDFSHDILNEEEMRALRRLAREQPCRMGNECEVVDCFAGHHCLRNKRCSDTCRFGAKTHANGKEMHVRDLRIVNAGQSGLGGNITAEVEEKSHAQGKQQVDANTVAAR